MQLINNKLMFSATDLTEFVECSFSTTLNYLKLQGDISSKKKDLNIALRKSADDHEKKYLKLLEQKSTKLVKISNFDDFDNKVSLTIESLNNLSNIYQPYLSKGNWGGIPDFIEINKDNEFQIIDAKFSNDVKTSYILQLCLYTELLSFVTDNFSSKTFLYQKNEQLLEISTKKYFDYYKRQKNNFEEFMDQKKFKSIVSPCSFCNRCGWQSYCDEKRKNVDHLSTIYNISKSQIKKIEDEGIHTTENFIKTDKKIKKLDDAINERLKIQATLQIEKTKTGHDVFKILDIQPGRGFYKLPPPTKGDLFFDIEGFPFVEGGLEYLFGVYELNSNEIEDSKNYKHFWAHNHEEEKKAVIQIIDYFIENITKYPHSHIYHYNHYEVTALNRLTAKYAVYEDKLNSLLRTKKFVDLYYIAKDSLQISEPRFSLKNFEVFYMQKRDQSIKTGDDSIEFYSQWRDTGDKKILDDIKKYNFEDCKSTYLMRNWLMKIKPVDIEFDNTEIQEIEKAINDDEIQYKKYQDKIEKYNESYPSKTNLLLSSLLEFHNRELRPQWWAYFDRQTKNHDELMDDKEAISGLIFKGSEGHKQTAIYKYGFFPQESKLKKNSTSIHEVSTGTKIGQVHDIDTISNEIVIKSSKESEKNFDFQLLKSITVTPVSPPKTIRGALYRFADYYLNSDSLSSLGKQILDRSIPKFLNSEDQKTSSDSNQIFEDLIKLSSSLDNSYFIIQGPPGTGKTFYSSAIIMSLLKNGKKIGITSNSHKAIHNLLDTVEKQSAESDFKFVGIKKGATNSEAYYQNKNFKSSSRIDNEIIKDADLIAGTAWCFVDHIFENKLDYLFIDEASQVSLANVIAMSLCCKNLIIVGDQMQLSLPIQGTHPSNSGVSCMDYLLSGYNTIPKSMGIFLSETMRMRSEITKFISSQFYDARLKNHINTNKNSIISSHKEINLNGLKFKEILHQDCSQKSEEEAKEIKDFIDFLLTQKINLNDNVRSITCEDIMVVSPYNVQVNYLTEFLNHKVNVGTVDKFQGQEAPIVLISMVTSSDENLPRDMGFLFSRNRLNVALSRAKCLAVIFMNPNLLDTKCSTKEQLFLLNTYCSLKNQSDKLIIEKKEFDE